jgi:hypothetical protein
MLKRSCLALVVATCLAIPAPVFAYHVVVQQGGGGDATTFQGGVDLLLATVPPTGLDTLLVMPGFYDEAVHIDLENLYGVSVIGPAGFERTRVRELHLDRHGVSYIEYGAVSVTGLSIVRPVIQGGEANRTPWRHCRFEGGYQATNGSDFVQSYEGCEFHGRVMIWGFVGAGPSTGIHDCRFAGATLTIGDQGLGDVGLTRCTFEGPVDTAVIAYPGNSDPMHFTDCRFSGVRYGIVDARAQARGGSVGPFIQRCVFEDVAEDAVRHASDQIFQDYDTYFSAPSLSVTTSRFRRCGSAIQWHSTAGPGLTLRADTIETIRGSGVVAEVGQCRIDGLAVSGCGGDGVVLTAHSGINDFALVLPIDVRNSILRDNAGSGLVVRDTMTATQLIGGIRVVECVMKGNSAAGIVCQGESLAVVGNIAHGNEGAGLDLTLSGAASYATLSQNSAVLNRGPGIRWRAESPGFLLVVNNLVAFNDGMGFSGVPTLGPTGNDAWSNALGSGVSEPKNLALDPGMCDPLGGDDHVQSNSPCAPTAPNHQIGALGVGCDASKIAIDVFPNQPNRPLADRSHALVPAAVLGTRVLDVATLDPLSARLGAALAVAGGIPAQRPDIRDVNDDRRLDLELWFDPRDIGSVPPSGSLPLTIATTSGLAEAGSDVVRETGLLSSEHKPGRVVDSQEGTAFRITAARFDCGTHRASIDFVVPGPGTTVAEFFDLSGRRVARVESVTDRAGVQTIELAAERQLSSGIYLVRLTRAHFALNTRLAVVR